ncbi:MAG TPA: alpha-ketoglutarate-dependent dioxygenase AlkB [Rhizomicrobium sp.]|jgi:alkylated DNA repair protein (DNA oxidative demethylase)|nr:alpha-ketoglutarate-dependent dioxygenase AlkB [Rhizomicrobium sp.]
MVYTVSPEVTPAAELTSAAARLEIMPGVALWPGYFDRTRQASLVADIFSRALDAPFYRPLMPRTGKPFSVEETNFGSLGWVSDESGYRYEKMHPLTGHPWPAMPPLLERTWFELTGCCAGPECCLVNLYRGRARMGLHQDRDEAELLAPVLSVSLGDDAVFRIGCSTRRAPSRSFVLRSGDVVVFGGPARLAFHAIDRVLEKSSCLVPGGGRLNLTLRRVARFPQQEDARPGG